MGNRVAVMQQGGHLAQYAPPSELLLQPANDFVSRFVGADRGLKRLALLKVSEVELQSAVVAHVGETGAALRGRADASGYVLLLDAAERPQGWVRVAGLAADVLVNADQVDPSSPIVTYETTLRDALSMLLASDVQTAVVEDERGRYAGVLTLEALSEAFRAPASDEPVEVA
jgi:osmoprotectant transport system ATP-binding protein